MGKSREVCFLRTPGCMPHSRCFVGSETSLFTVPFLPAVPSPRLCRTPAWRFHPHSASYTVDPLPSESLEEHNCILDTDPFSLPYQKLISRPPDFHSIFLYFKILSYFQGRKKWDLSFNSWKYFTKASWQ